MKEKNIILLLDVLSRYPCTVNGIIYANKVDTYYSYNFQEYSSREIEKIVFEMLSQDFCYIQSNDVDITKQSLNFFCKERKFDFQRYDCIGLTQLGGQRWEELFKPNWSNFIDVLYDDVSYLNPVNMDLKSSNKSLLMEILKPLNIENIEDFFILEKEWQPCYWKVISDLNCYNFNYTANSIDEKIIIDEIYNSLSNYSKLFCEDTEYFL